MGSSFYSPLNILRDCPCQMLLIRTLKIKCVYTMGLVNLGVNMFPGITCKCAETSSLNARLVREGIPKSFLLDSWKRRLRTSREN